MTQAQRGFGAIAVIAIVVILAGAAAALVRLGQSSQIAITQDLLGERASLAARAGVDWGLYQAIKGSWTACSGASQTLDLTADLGMRVTVGCTSSSYNEGESVPGTPQAIRIYTIDAVACNAASACPDATAAIGSTYVERRRRIHVTN